MRWIVAAAAVALTVTAAGTALAVDTLGSSSRGLLDDGQPKQGDEVYIPQHPKGVPTVIAMSDPQEATGNCAVIDPRYDGYAPDTDVSYRCDTDGGSSGSPVISRQTNKVIALHHFGGCPNSGVRIDLIASRIVSLL